MITTTNNDRRLNVLVGCEYSGRVRQAFRSRGHNAWSCDLLPADDHSSYHYQFDIVDIIQCRPKSDPWDIIIMFPECTKLCVSGNRWYGKGMEKHDQRLESVKWTADLFKLACSHARYVAMENPVGVLPKMAGMKASQYIQPWMFSHPESKKTGLWLHNLNPLVPTDNVKELHDSLPRKERMRVHHMSPGENRWKERSTTYAGVAEAMGDQWSKQVTGELACK